MNTVLNKEQILLVVDLAATFFLGIEGASAAISANLDLFGVMVLSFATALGGGVIRDLLIGVVPPGSIRDSRYAITAFLGGLLAFLLHHMVQQIPADVLVCIDAAGLSLFCVAGAVKAIDFKINGLMSTLMGTITGVGGGTVRDIFLARIPAILQVDVYAMAALIGAAVTVIMLKLRRPRVEAMIAGALVCFTVRLVSVWQHWNLPKVTD